MSSSSDLPTIFFETADAWEAWLAEHVSDSGVWLKFYKKDSGVASLTYQPALEVALCYGWIDGQAAKGDDAWYVQRFTPRRARSVWSKRNCDIAERLIHEGKMRPAGQAQVDAARADGRWDAAYAAASQMEIPADFLEALKTNKQAEAFYATLNRTNLFSIYYRLATAKKPETRAKRMTQIIAMLSEGKKFH
jgi:uncharacterized protein YdeI (YjbR/CyaY-like superfamily)